MTVECLVISRTYIYITQSKTQGTLPKKGWKEHKRQKRWGKVKNFSTGLMDTQCLNSLIFIQEKSQRKCLKVILNQMRIYHIT